MKKKKKTTNLKKKPVKKPDNEVIGDLFLESLDPDLEYRKMLNECLIAISREVLFEHREEIIKRAEIMVKLRRDAYLKDRQSKPRVDLSFT